MTKKLSGVAMGGVGLFLGLVAMAGEAPDAAPPAGSDQRGPGRHGQDAMEQRRAEMFDELDANKDGQISREEFQAARRPGRMDRPRGEPFSEGGRGPASRPAGGPPGGRRGPLAGPPPQGPPPPGADDFRPHRRPGPGGFGGGRGGPGGPGGPGGFRPEGGPGGPGGGFRGGRGGPQGPPLFPLLDANHDGKLQTPEIQKVFDLFKEALDASQKEALTPEDWMELVQKHRPLGLGPRPEGPGPDRDRPDRAERRRDKAGKHGGPPPGEGAAPPPEPPPADK